MVAKRVLKKARTASSFDEPQVVSHESAVGAAVLLEDSEDSEDSGEGAIRMFAATAPKSHSRPDHAAPAARRRSEEVLQSAKRGENAQRKQKKIQDRAECLEDQLEDTGKGRGGLIIGDEEKRSFDALGLENWLVKSCTGMGLARPTDVQWHCVPEILAGRDVMASAETGSGKTAAFALPILQLLAKDPYGIFALVLTPTRELAFQIEEQFAALGSSIALRRSVVVGGLDMMKQSIELCKRPHVVIATPGRLADHIHSSHGVAAALKKTKFLVLDEADRLFEASFGTHHFATPRLAAYPSRLRSTCCVCP